MPPRSWLPAAPASKKPRVAQPREEGKIRVGFQGELGAYSEVAVRQHYQDADVQPVPCENFEEVSLQKPATLDCLLLERVQLALRDISGWNANACVVLVGVAVVRSRQNGQGRHWWGCRGCRQSGVGGWGGGQNAELDAGSGGQRHVAS